MAKQAFTKPIGKMNLDRGATSGDHAWVIKNLILTANGYETMPKPESSFTFGPGDTPQGAYFWQGGETSRSYIALNSTIWEIDAGTTATDVSGASYTNSTNGVTFAGYGEFCFASNGVDPIQAILVPSATGSSVNFANMQYTSGGAQIAPKYIFSHKNHLIGLNARMIASYNQLGTHTTAVGSAFTNQPSNDAVEVLSSSAADTQSFTIYGTRIGTGDTVHFESGTLNGTTVVTTSITNWDRILAVKVGAGTVGTITWREASGNATITTTGPGVTSSGVSAVSPALSAANQTVTIVASAASTRQVGLSSTSWNGGVVYDSQALTGTTALQSNDRFINVLEVFIGDVENTVTVTVTTFEFAVGSEHPYTAWISATDDPEGFGKPDVNRTFVGVELLPLLDGQGKITGGIDGGDAFFIFKEGSIYRIDGPPFVPTVISYNIGMPAGCTPYRQADRVYFWSRSGLHYINTSTNEIVNLFEGRMLRSVTDWGGANYGLITGVFPKYTGPGTFEFENITATQERVSISGNSRYGYVIVSYTNDSLGKGLLLYQSKEDCFVIPGGISDNLAVVWELKEEASTAPYPMSSIRAIIDNGANNAVYKWNISPLAGRAVTFAPTVILPFDHFEDKNTIGRVVRIRPIFEDQRLDLGLTPNWTASTARVISMSGVGTNWHYGVSTVHDSTSSDGWFSFSGCPDANAHSVAFVFAEETGGQSFATAATAMEIEVELGAGRSR